MFDLLWLPEAESVLDGLESANPQAVAAIRRLLARMEVDPFAPSLGTQQFRGATSGFVRATSCRYDDWYVLWRFTEAREVEIILIVDIAI